MRATILYSQASTSRGANIKINLRPNLSTLKEPQKEGRFYIGAIKSYLPKPGKKKMNAYLKSDCSCLLACKKLYFEKKSSPPEFTLAKAGAGAG